MDSLTAVSTPFTQNHTPLFIAPKSADLASLAFSPSLSIDQQPTFLVTDAYLKALENARLCKDNKGTLIDAITFDPLPPVPNEVIATINHCLDTPLRVPLIGLNIVLKTTTRRLINSFLQIQKEEWGFSINEVAYVGSCTRLFLKKYARYALETAAHSQGKDLNQHLTDEAWALLEKIFEDSLNDYDVRILFQPHREERKQKVLSPQEQIAYKASVKETIARALIASEIHEDSEDPNRKDEMRKGLTHLQQLSSLPKIKAMTDEDPDLYLHLVEKFAFNTLKVVLTPEGELETIIFSVGDRTQVPLDIMFTNGNVLSSFTSVHNSLRFPILPLLYPSKKPSTDSVPVSELGNGLQAISDNLARVVHPYRPEINDPAYAEKFFTNLIKGYRCPFLELEGILLRSLLQGARAGRNKSVAVYIQTLVAKWCQTHHQDNSLNTLILTLQVCCSFQNLLRTDEAYLRQQGLFEEGFITIILAFMKSSWEREKLSATNGDPPLAIAIAEFLNSGKFSKLGDRLFPFISALLQLGTFLQLQVEEKSPAALTRHGDNYAIQLQVGKRFLLIPFEPLAALDCFVSCISSPDLARDPQCFALIDTILACLYPRRAFGGLASSPLIDFKEALTIASLSQRNSFISIAKKLLGHPHPAISHLGYLLALAINALTNEPLLVEEMLKILPSFLMREKNEQVRLQILSSLEALVVKHPWNLKPDVAKELFACLLTQIDPQEGAQPVFSRHLIQSLATSKPLFPIVMRWWESIDACAANCQFGLQLLEHLIEKQPNEAISLFLQLKEKYPSTLFLQLSRFKTVDLWLIAHKLFELRHHEASMELVIFVQEQDRTSDSTNLSTWQQKFTSVVTNMQPQEAAKLYLAAETRDLWRWDKTNALKPQLLLDLLIRWEKTSSPAQSSLSLAFLTTCLSAPIPPALRQQLQKHCPRAPSALLSSSQNRLPYEQLLRELALSDLIEEGNRLFVENKFTEACATVQKISERLETLSLRSLKDPELPLKARQLYQKLLGKELAHAFFITKLNTLLLSAGIKKLFPLQEWVSILIRRVQQSAKLSKHTPQISESAMLLLLRAIKVSFNGNKLEKALESVLLKEVFTALKENQNPIQQKCLVQELACHHAAVIRSLLDLQMYQELTFLLLQFFSKKELLFPDFQNPFEEKDYRALMIKTASTFALFETLLEGTDHHPQTLRQLVQLLSVLHQISPQEFLPIKTRLLLALLPPLQAQKLHEDTATCILLLFEITPDIFTERDYHFLLLQTLSGLDPLKHQKELAAFLEHVLQRTPVPSQGLQNFYLQLIHTLIEKNSFATALKLLHAVKNFENREVVKNLAEKYANACLRNAKGNSDSAIPELLHLVKVYEITNWKIWESTLHYLSVGQFSAPLHTELLEAMQFADACGLADKQPDIYFSFWRKIVLYASRGTLDLLLAICHQADSRWVAIVSASNYARKPQEALSLFKELFTLIGSFVKKDKMERKAAFTLVVNLHLKIRPLCQKVEDISLQNALTLSLCLLVKKGDPESDFAQVFSFVEERLFPQKRPITWNEDLTKAFCHFIQESSSGDALKRVGPIMPALKKSSLPYPVIIQLLRLHQNTPDPTVISEGFGLLLKLLDATQDKPRALMKSDEQKEANRAKNETVCFLNYVSKLNVDNKFSAEICRCLSHAHIHFLLTNQECSGLIRKLIPVDDLANAKKHPQKLEAFFKGPYVVIKENIKLIINLDDHVTLSSIFKNLIIYALLDPLNARSTWDFFNAEFRYLLGQKRITVKPQLTHAKAIEIPPEVITQSETGQTLNRKQKKRAHNNFQQAANNPHTHAVKGLPTKARANEVEATNVILDLFTQTDLEDNALFDAMMQDEKNLTEYVKSCKKQNIEPDINNYFQNHENKMLQDYHRKVEKAVDKATEKATIAATFFDFDLQFLFLVQIHNCCSEQFDDASSVNADSIASLLLIASNSLLLLIKQTKDFPPKLEAEFYKCLQLASRLPPRPNDTSVLDCAHELFDAVLCKDCYTIPLEDITRFHILLMDPSRPRPLLAAGLAQEILRKVLLDEVLGDSAKIKIDRFIQAESILTAIVEKDKTSLYPPNFLIKVLSDVVERFDKFYQPFSAHLQKFITQFPTFGVPFLTSYRNLINHLVSFTGASTQSIETTIGSETLQKLIKRKDLFVTCLDSLLDEEKETTAGSKEKTN